MGQEEDRQNSPLMPEERWDTTLKELGFTGLDLTLPDTPDIVTHQGSTTMISRAVIETPPIGENGSVSASSQAKYYEDLVLVKTNTTTDSSLDEIIQQILKHNKLGGNVQGVVDFDSLQPDDVFFSS